MIDELGSASPGVSFDSRSGLTGDCVGTGRSVDESEMFLCSVSRRPGGGDILSDCARDLLRYGLTPSGAGNCKCEKGILARCVVFFRTEVLLPLL